MGKEKGPGITQRGSGQEKPLVFLEQGNLLLDQPIPGRGTFGRLLRVTSNGLVLAPVLMRAGIPWISQDSLN